MIIFKGDKEIVVEERQNCWVISRKVGKLSMEYKIPKDICADEDALRAYVEKESLF